MAARLLAVAALACGPFLILTGCAAVPDVSGVFAAPSPRLVDAPLRWTAGATKPGVAAVLIAADVYDAQPSWGLPSAATSAAAVRSMLIAQRGVPESAIRVLSGSEVTADHVEAAIRRAGDQLRGVQGAALWVYFCGHGWIQDGEQALFTHVTREEGSSYAKVITRGDLLRWMAAARTQAASSEGVLIVDACRRNVGDPPPKARLLRSDVWEVYGVKEGRLVAAGSGGAPFAFTAALVEAAGALGAAAGDADLRRLFAETRIRTLQRTDAQDPDLVAPEGAGAAPLAIASRRVRFTLRVVDALSGVRLRDVRVAFDDGKYGAAEGECELSGSRSEHILQVQAAGYLGRTERFRLDDAQQGAGLDLPLCPALTVIRGRIEPPTVTKVTATCEGAREGYHVCATASDASGHFELRVPALVGTRVEIARDGAAPDVVPLPAVVEQVVADAEGRFDGIGVVTVEVAMRGVTVARPAGAPHLHREADRSDWERAQQMVDLRRYDLARQDVGKLTGGEAFESYRRWLDSRWAEHDLEDGLREGKEADAWRKADAVAAWWNEAPRTVDNEPRVRALVDEYTRERFPLAARRQYEAGNAALAEGRLEAALVAYETAWSDLSTHYAALVTPHVVRIRARLYDRHMSAGRQAELERAWPQALDAYATAAGFDLLARRDAARILAEHAELAGTPTAIAFAKAAPMAPAGWDCEVLAGAAAAGQPPRVVRDRRTGIVFRLVPAGEFAMGSTTGLPDEAPVHRVRITRPFYLAETETTQAQWQALMGSNPSRIAGAEHPVENVSWHDANVFVRKLNGGRDGSFRLPTEAEWEYACRARATTEYAFGHSVTPAQVLYRDYTYVWVILGLGWPSTGEVRSLAANGWGFWHMHGNVAEWCQDSYVSDAYRSGEGNDPLVVSDAPLRVVRGGSRGTFKSYARSASREGVDPALRHHYIGFRVARSL